MKMVVACGGTGGHIYPAIAVAQAFREGGEGDEVRFIGSRRGPEATLVPKAGFPFLGIPVAGIHGKSAAGRARGLALLPVAVARAAAALLRSRPDVVLGTGGFASGPVLLAAGALRRPTVIQEQNRRLGWTNRFCSRFASEVALSFPETAAEIGRGVVTGNPVRREFFQVGRPPMAPGRLSLLVFGGSQGARSLNRAVVEALPRLKELGDRIFIRHQTGPANHEAVAAAYHEAGMESAEVLAYVDPMAEAFARADLVVCRAGASTVAELCAAGRASVLVPYPHATADHQRENAEALASRGAAELVEDAGLDADAVCGLAERFLAEPETLVRMGEAARSLARPEAAARIAGIARQLGLRREGGGR
jgi:UDP-N-acetylglucosamine--N-acetylmuramyl-(pentapeptide) pyrophosphoryl-undecaprenol N-acetylglucosamine transferase